LFAPALGTVVDLERMRIVSSFPVGAAPDGVAWVR
jgi:hypothetical protein